VIKMMVWYRKCVSAIIKVLMLDIGFLLSLFFILYHKISKKSKLGEVALSQHFKCEPRGKQGHSVPGASAHKQ
jgi:hypothetical protein